MENFNENEQHVKGKSVYLLHLDTPRIILISSIILGVIAGSFLIGMNMMKPAAQDDTLRITDSSRGNSDILKPDTRETLKGEIPALPKDSLSRDNDVVDAVSPEKTSNEKIDLITGKNLTDATGPSYTEKETVIKAAPSREKITRKTPEKKITARKPRVKKKKKQSKIVAVSVPRTKPQPRLSGPYYAIQIVSYDSKSKARKEAGKLEKLKFDTYVDRSRVNGKLYYRVRIGPITSKDTALETLNEVQAIERYQESYMVREKN